ncbi:hypothetical protein [Rhizobium sp. B21/90]|uniref:hypothetical protein n=1 Tax=Rhizobium sp. B21/90 TaxID=2819993 RepID=UPI001C5AE9EC|nr:hypothetical protein [Rhizobium sp. B21/90]QYA03845.1 hypothetical protein J5278_23970 [Rhizobium sp. B21/90]
MSEERDLEIAKEYRSRGGVGRLMEDGETISRDEGLDPPEADQYWEEFITPRVDAGDHYGIFQHLR